MCFIPIVWGVCVHRNLVQIKFLSTFIVLLALLFSNAGYSADFETGVTSEISRVADATHLEFKGLKTWKYDLKRIEGQDYPKMVLRVAPLSTDSVRRLKTYTDNLIEKIEVNERGIDDSFEITFHLRSDRVDAFDYQTDKPSGLVVDFYHKDDDAKEAVTKSSTPTKPVTEIKEKVSANAISKELPLKSAVKAEKSRKPATSELLQGQPAPQGALELGKEFRHGIFDGGDPEFKRFSIEDYEIHDDALIASRANVYLRFPMLRIESRHLNNLMQNPPIYEIEPKESEETKEAQLLLTLFKNKRQALFLKTAKYFLNKYPETKYEEIVKYMMADQYYQFWKDDKDAANFELAMGLYRYLAERFPDSPLATRTILLMGYAQQDRGDSFAALNTFQRFERLKPESKFFDQVKISEAEAYLNLKKFDEAYKILDDVEKTAKTRKDSFEAAFRKGDIYFEDRDYPAAIAKYREAIKKYPEAAGEYPNAFFNTAEALYWKQDYRQALNAYREFLQRFPDNKYGGYAMTRLGESLEILGADPKRSMGAYLEAYFRYRDTPGAAVARVRTLFMKMPEMKEKELNAAFEEIDSVTEKLDLPNIKEFVTLIESDGQYLRKKYVESYDGLISFYQMNPNSPEADRFKGRIVRGITAEIQENVVQKKFIDALRVYSRFAGSWLKGNERVDLKVYVGQAYEQAGVYKEAGQIYRDSLNKVYAAKGTKIEKERGVFEKIPSADSLNLRLAVTSAKQGEFTQSADFLKSIKTPQSLSEAEQIERAETSADVAVALGQIDTAKKFLEQLLQAWKGQPVATSGLYLKLAELGRKTGDSKNAEVNVEKVLAMQSDTGLVPGDVHAKALELKGDLLLARGKRAQAVETYKELLEGYESKSSLSSVRYRAGKVLFEDKDIKGAETVWNELKSDDKSMWYKLAQEQLQNAKWKGDYKRYIDRIPAMQDMRKK